MFEKFFEYVATEHRGKAVGILLGLIASILFVSFGFWQTIFIMLCIGAGYVIGTKIDDNVDLELWLKNIFKPRR